MQSPPPLQMRRTFLLRKVSAALLLIAVSTGCATQTPRAAPSSLGCMQAVTHSLPMELSDEQKHCVAAGMIARRCSRVEAAMAGIGKELKDVVTVGDASWADLRSDRKGMRCAREALNEDSLVSCCVS